MKIKPVREVALIKPQRVDDKTDGGIWIPEWKRDRMQYAVDRGELIAFGEGFYQQLHGPIPKIGDMVLFDKYKGTLIQIKNKEGVREDYRLLNDDEIIGILEGKEND